MHPFPPVIVINLFRSTARRAHIVAQLKQLGLGFSVLRATDKRSLSSHDRSRYDDAMARQTAGRSLTDGEIACVLSHARAWRRIVDNQWDMALVLEDDAILDPRITGILESPEALPGDWGLVNFCTDGGIGETRVQPAGGPAICPIVSRMNGAVGYLIRRQVAAAALGHVFPIRRAVDGLLAWMRHEGAFVAYATRPQLVRVDDALHRSDIGRRGTGPARGGDDAGKTAVVPSPLGPGRVGIAVSTYSHDRTASGRYGIIRRSLDSLLASTAERDAGELLRLIVVDGPVPAAHERLLADYSDDFRIIRKAENGGAARAKNTAIRTLLDAGVEIGYLADDDVLFHRGWLEAYTGFSRSEDVHHIAGFASRHFFPEGPRWRDLNVGYETVGNWPVIRHRGAHGHFLSFTAELIRRIGYFRVYPGKMGGWHANFTYRAVRAGLGSVRWPVDLADSDRFLEHIGQDDDWVWGGPNDLASVSRHRRNHEWIKNQELDFYRDPHVLVEAEE